MKIDDSYTFWKDFGSCQGDREDLFGVCIWHGPQGYPKGAPRAPKRRPRVPQGLPKDVPKGDFEGRGEYLRWFPPYPSSAGAGLPEIAVWDPLARLGHM